MGTPLRVLSESYAMNTNITGFAVNSRKSRTVFINYDFRQLMVAEIFRK